MTDEQRWDSLSCMGNTDVKTPNMDSIAKEGFVFRNAFCAAPLCVPSRVCFFTGQYVHRNMAVSNGIKSHIKTSQLSLVELFKEAGYRIGLAGKNHTFDDDYMDKWFDFREEYFHFGKTKGTFTVEDKRIVEYFRERRGEGLIDGPAPFAEEHWIDNRIAEDGIRFVENCGRHPFFLYFSFPGPHWPNVVCEPYYSMFPPEGIGDLEACDIDWSSHPFKHFVQSQVNGFDRYSTMERKRILSTYYGQIASIDAAIGKLMEKIRQLGLEGDTLIVFTADHGNFAGRYGLVGKTGGFFDALLKVPLMIKIPGYGSGGRSISGEVSNIDLMPTLLELSGMDIPDGVQGKSMVQLMDGKEERLRSEIFAEVGAPRYPLNPVDPKDFKELDRKMSKERGSQWFCDYSSNGRSAMIRKDGWKYCYYVGDKDEMYDLSSDPFETKNLSSEPSFSCKKEEMRRQLMDWLLMEPYSD